MKILAYVFGIGAMISLFLIYQQRSRKRLIAAKLSADVFWVAHYFCLGAAAGIIPNFLGIFRELIFINRKGRRWAQSILWPILFILLGWGLGLRTFHSPVNVLPILASSFVTVSLWIDNPRLTKAISFPVSLAFLIYDIFVGSYIGVINEAISMTSIVLFFTKSKKERIL